MLCNAIPLFCFLVVLILEPLKHRGKQNRSIAIFWDLGPLIVVQCLRYLYSDWTENCPVPHGSSAYDTVEYLRALSRPFGLVQSFNCYSGQYHNSHARVCPMLQASGVSLIYTPHNGRKDMADKVIISRYQACWSHSPVKQPANDLTADMLKYSLGTHSHLLKTIILVSGDRDYAYPLSSMRLNGKTTVLVTPQNSHESLTTQASVCLKWDPPVPMKKAWRVTCGIWALFLLINLWQSTIQPSPLDPYFHNK